MHDMHEPEEPKWIHAILSLVLRGEDAEYILGDLSEDFRRLADSSGPSEARAWYRRQALRAVGSRFVRRPRSFEAWRRDVRIAARRVGREPSYSLTTVVTLGLGIGGVAAVASLAASVMRPLPFPDARDLHAVWEIRDDVRSGVAPANYLDWRRMSRTFAGLAAHQTRSVSITAGGSATRARIVVVSGNFFDVLGVAPRVGSGFEPELEVAFADRIIVLSHDASMAIFGSERPIGRSVLIDDAPYVVVGVMPPGFSFPEEGVQGWIRSPTEAPDIRGFEGDLTEMRDAWYFEVVGRLAEGRTVADARAEMASISDRLAELHPDTNEGRGTLLVPLLEQTIAGFGAIMVALGIAVGLILTGAIFNLTHLTLARAESRGTDFAVRLALGASAGDLRRSAFAEGWLLGLLGAGLGIALAHLGLTAAVADLGDAIPRASSVGLSPLLAGVAALLGLAVGTLVALTSVPAKRPLPHVRSEGASRTQGRRLIGVQVAVAIAMVMGTALLTGSVMRVGSVDLGFETDRLTTLRIAIPDAASRAYAERVSQYRGIADALRAVPGVSEVGIGSDAPTQLGPRAGVVVEGRPPESNPPDAGWQPVDQAYFEAFGMQVVRGRAFSGADGADGPDVAVVNEAFARTVLGGMDPIGVHVTMGLDGHDRPLRIVGVVADTHTRGPMNPPGAVLYRPIDQTTSSRAESALLALKWSTEPSDALAVVRRVVRDAAPGLPLYSLGTGDDLVRPFVRAQTLLLTVMGVFTITALAIGMIGVYGVGLHTVRRQRRAIGIRLSLGATGHRITREVVQRGLGSALLGVPPGVLLAILVGRSMSRLLFELGGTDVRLLAGSVSFVLLLTACALFVPARAAASFDPARVTKEA